MTREGETSGKTPVWLKQTHIAELDCSPGDFLRHQQFGVCRYEGTRAWEYKGESTTVVVVTFTDDARLYVPTSHLDLLEKLKISPGDSVALGYFPLPPAQQSERNFRQASAPQNASDGRRLVRYITSEIRREVWRRDQGRCTSCGGRERLEFDHIVPVSRGGSNTVRNIELLCEICNRKKAANI